MKHADEVASIGKSLTWGTADIQTDQYQYLGNCTPTPPLTQQ